MPTEDKILFEEKVWLPDWLFLKKRTSTTQTQKSPAALFVPNAAVSNENPWPNSLTPATKLEIKKLVITKLFSDYLSPNELLAEVSWFRLQGFEIYLAIEGNPTFRALIGEHTHLTQEDIQSLGMLRYFDETEDQDYLTLAALKIASGDVIAPDASMLCALQSCLNCDPAELEKDPNKFSIFHACIPRKLRMQILEDAYSKISSEAEEDHAFTLWQSRLLEWGAAPLEVMQHLLMLAPQQFQQANEVFVFLLRYFTQYPQALRDFFTAHRAGVCANNLMTCLSILKDDPVLSDEIYQQYHGELLALFLQPSVSDQLLELKALNPESAKKIYTDLQLTPQGAILGNAQIINILQLCRLNQSILNEFFRAHSYGINRETISFWLAAAIEDATLLKQLAKAYPDLIDQQLTECIPCFRNNYPLLAEILERNEGRIAYITDLRVPALLACSHFPNLFREFWKDIGASLTPEEQGKLFSALAAENIQFPELLHEVMAKTQKSIDAETRRKTFLDTAIAELHPSSYHDQLAANAGIRPVTGGPLSFYIAQQAAHFKKQEHFPDAVFLSFVLDNTRLEDFLDEVRSQKMSNLKVLEIYAVPKMTPEKLQKAVILIRNILHALNNTGIQQVVLPVEIEPTLFASRELERSNIRYPLRFAEPLMQIEFMAPENAPDHRELPENPKEGPVDQSDLSDLHAQRNHQISVATRVHESLADIPSAQVDMQTFQMLNVGRVLNPDLRTIIRARTGIVQLEENSLQQSTKTPKHYMPVVYRPLTSENVEQLSTRLPADGIYCEFRQQLQQHVRTRLLSIDAQEELIGIVGAPDGLVLQRGDDGFYYATNTTSKACDISYVLKQAPQKTYEDLPHDSKTYSILQEYFSGDYQTKLAANSAAPTRQSSQQLSDWLHAVYEQKSGACGQRSAAVYCELLRQGVSPDLVQVVDINHNHRVIEVRATPDEDWISVDLGGELANVIESTEQKAYQAPRPATLLPNTAEETSKDKASPAEHLPMIRPASLDQSSTTTPTTRAPILDKMRTLIARKHALKAIESQEDLVADISLSSSPAAADPSPTRNVLLHVEKSSRAHVVHFLLAEARRIKRPVFYIDSPRDIDINRLQIRITEDGESYLTHQGLLEDFLTAASHTAKTSRPLLMINWANFTPQECLQLNTVLDRVRTIHGKDIAENIQIVGLYEEVPKDISFLSRYQKLLDWRGYFGVAPTLTQAQTAAAQVIDLKGYRNWMETLFGPIKLQNNQPVWHKSDFVLALEAAEKTDRGTPLEIIHADSSSLENLKTLIAQARASGAFFYHGYRIPFPEKVSVNCARQDFNFREFTSCVVYQKADAQSVPPDAALINTYLFDALLGQKNITPEGLYQETLGLLAAHHGKPLSLFITTTLAEAQWYCLLSEAKSHNVALSLYLAPGVTLPSGLPSELKHLPTALRQAKPSLPQIYVSTNTDAALAELKRTQGNLVDVFNVEDYDYGDFFSDVDFSFNQERTAFAKFSVLVSEVIEKLRAGQAIVLKGAFSESLLQILHPLLCGQTIQLPNGESFTPAQNLIFIIEDKSLRAGNKAPQIYTPLEFLGPLPANHLRTDPTPKIVQQIIDEKSYEPGDWQTIDLSHSAEKATAFMQRRVRQFFTELDAHVLLQLVGNTGVGKSYLLETVASDYRDQYEVYYELAGFEAYATSKSSKKKILFIDESNIDDTHRMMFLPLGPDGSRHILYRDHEGKQKIYPLDATHHVVFARNPKQFGGGRVDQNLFQALEIPECYLQDFSPDYIYERLLKPVFLASDLRITEEVFKKDCEIILTVYHARNHPDPSQQKGDPKSVMTVRELQQWALYYCADRLRRKNILQSLPPLDKGTEALKKAQPAVVARQNLGFLPTPATAHARSQMALFIDIHQRQHAGTFSDTNGWGLNGFLVEGTPGIGKSEMVRFMLESKGYRLGKPDEPEGPKDIPPQLCYYKIDASVFREEKESILLRAFKEGNAVLLDEINACLDDGLEKTVNALLTGHHPYTKERSPHPGFMIFGTANGVHLEGRRVTSDAVRHRSIQVSPDPLKCIDIEAIVKHFLNNEIPDYLDIPRFAEYFLQLMKEDKNINLRTLRDCWPDLLALEKEYYGSLSMEEYEQLRAQQTQRLHASAQAAGGSGMFPLGASAQHRIIGVEVATPPAVPATEDTQKPIA